MGWTWKQWSGHCAAALTLLIGLAAPTRLAEAQTYRKTWTTSADFDSGTHSNTTASAVANQVQLDRSGTRREQLWIANSASDTVARMDGSTGEVLSLTTLPAGSNPSRIAVDREGNAWVALPGRWRGCSLSGPCSAAGETSGEVAAERLFDERRTEEPGTGSRRRAAPSGLSNGF